MKFKLERSAKLEPGEIVSEILDIRKVDKEGNPTEIVLTQLKALDNIFIDFKVTDSGAEII